MIPARFLPGVPYRTGPTAIVNTACTVTYVPFILCVARLSGSGSGSPPRTNQRAAGALDCCGPRQASPSNADAGMHAGSPWNVNFRFLPPTPYLLSSYRSSSLHPFHLPYPPPARASHSIHLCHSLSVLTPFFILFYFVFELSLFSFTRFPFYAYIPVTPSSLINRALHAVGVSHRLLHLTLQGASSAQNPLLSPDCLYDSIR